MPTAGTVLERPYAPVFTRDIIASTPSLKYMNAEKAQRYINYYLSPNWKPQYSVWRHGGSRIPNLTYPSGALGCIASGRTTISGRFEIAFDPRGERGQYRTREQAALAERDIVVAQWRAVKAAYLECEGTICKLLGIECDMACL